MDIKMDKDKIAKALFKKAIGYDFEESVEEYSIDEDSGQMKKNKAKVNKKHLPPDIPAIKTLFELYQQEFESKYDKMNEKELLEEREKLLKLLSKTNPPNEENM